MCSSSNSSLEYLALGILEQEDARLHGPLLFLVYIYCLKNLIGKILILLLNFNIKYVRYSSAYWRFFFVVLNNVEKGVIENLKFKIGN